MMLVAVICLEYWNIGILECWESAFIHHSIILRFSLSSNWLLADSRGLDRLSFYFGQESAIYGVGFLVRLYSTVVHIPKFAHKCDFFRRHGSLLHNFRQFFDMVGFACPGEAEVNLGVA